jgi:uncharacterized repeat protein (TIGR03803 family)
VQKSQRWRETGLLCLAWAIAAQASHAQTFTTVVNFNNSTVAYTPSYGSLIQAADGNFYGTTQGGGMAPTGYGAYGTVFKMDSSGAITILHTFINNGADGMKPMAGLIQGADENFYGTTAGGGANGKGAVFEMTPDGTLTILHSFNGADGQAPMSALVQGADGNLYGTTYGSGATGGGTIFEIASDGTFTTLYNFNQDLGPASALIQGADGNFYGTSLANPYGSIFQITSTGTFTTLYKFGSFSADGTKPYGGLIQGADDNFYGTTYSGGDHNMGTVFEFSLNGVVGALTILHSFDGVNDGSQPYGALIQDADGNFYGTTISGARSGTGSVFEVTSTGTLTTLHNFAISDGQKPYAGLTQASDGSFYGTTTEGGATFTDSGTVFRLIPAL